MDDSLERLRPKSTAGIVATAVVAITLLPVLVIEAPWVLFALVVVAPMMWFFSQTGALDGDGESDSLAGDEAALDRLRRRYADGELSDDEFERRLDRLLETETLEDAKRRRDRSSERELER